MRHRAEFVEVTSCARLPERGEFPGDSLGAPDMTAVAAQSRAVIHVSGRRVPICHRCPEIGPMTRIAGNCREEMARRLAFSGDAIVAAHARPVDARVIDPSARKGHGTLMARLTRGIGQDVFCRLTGSDRAAMTSGAIRNEPRVVHAGPSERYRTLVASLARGIGDDVVRQLASRGNAVVTACTAAHEPGVVRFC